MGTLFGIGSNGYLVLMPVPPNTQVIGSRKMRTGTGQDCDCIPIFGARTILGETVPNLILGEASILCSTLGRAVILNVWDWFVSGFVCHVACA